MISELIDFGRWLEDNGQGCIGDPIKDDANIFIFALDEELTKISFKEVLYYKEYKQKMSDSISPFERNLYILTGNDSLTDTKGIGGLSPFFFKLSSSLFVKKNLKKNPDEKKNQEKKGYIQINDSADTFVGFNREKLKSKLYTSRKEKGMNYTTHLKYILSEKELVQKYAIDASSDLLEKIVTKYFDTIEKDIMEKNPEKDSEIVNALKNASYKDLTKSAYYFYFSLPDDKKWINDLFLDYVKFFKKQNDKIKFITGTCPFCREQNKTLVYKEFPFFALQKPNYNWNFKNEELEGSKFRICKECNYFLQLGFDTLKDELGKDYLLIPRPKTDADAKEKYGEFLKEIRSNDGKFEKINSALKSLSRDFNFDFVIYTMGNNRQIKKYVSNYKAFLLEFKNINIYNGNRLRYLFGELDEGPSNKSKIESTFDLEGIIKKFFVDVQDGHIVDPMYNYLYEIYVKELTGKNGIFYKFNSKTVSIFAKYRENLFALVYELDKDSVSKEMLNEIAVNCLTNLEKHKMSGEIKKRLNYYFLLRKELIGDNMMGEKEIEDLKQICNRYGEENREKMTDRDKKRILEIVENDPAIKYYLIGQFIRLLEGIKAHDGKKSDLFTAYMSNSNRNNIKSLFVTEILKKNNYYISRLNEKGKLIFNIMESNPDLFSDKSLSYEDYVLFMFTGYYTENILSSNYGNPTNEKEEKLIRGDRK